MARWLASLACSAVLGLARLALADETAPALPPPPAMPADATRPGAPEPPAPLLARPGPPPHDLTALEPAPPPELPWEQSWYGWQTLAVDSLSLAMIVVGAGSDDGGGMIAGGMIGYLMAAPVVHGAHGRAGAAFGSLGLRVVMPLVGGWAGTVLEGNCSAKEWGCLEGLALGIMVGAGAAIVLDAAVLAHEDVPKAERARIGARPMLTLAKDRVGAGVAGWF